MRHKLLIEPADMVKFIIRGVHSEVMLLAALDKIKDKILMVSLVAEYVSVMQTYVSYVELHHVLIRGLASIVLELLEEY